MAPKRTATAMKTAMTKAEMPGVKRSRREEAQPKAKLELVKQALGSPELEMATPFARELLLAAVDVALKGESEDRHEYQTSVAKMIEETFVRHRESLEATLAGKKKFLEEANETKAEIEGRLEATTKNLEAKKEEILGHKAVKTTEEAAVKETSAALEKQQAALREFETQRKDLLSKQTKQDEVYDQCFKVLRDTAFLEENKKEAEKLLKRLLAMLKSMNAAEGLYRGISMAILKAPEARGSFDTVAINEVEKLFTTTGATMKEKLAESADQVAQQESLSGEADQAQKAASVKLAATVELLSTTESEKREFEKELKGVQTELKKHEKKVLETSENVGGAEEKIATFAKVEEALHFLNTYTKKKLETESEPVAEVEVEAGEVEAEVQAEALGFPIQEEMITA